MKRDSDDDLRPEDAKRLRVARMAAGFTTAKAAAERFGWTYETYQQHEKGTRGFARVAPDYARAFRVRVGWLLSGEGNGPTEQTVQIRHGLTPDEIDEIERDVDAIRDALIQRKLDSRLRIARAEK